MGGLDVVTDTRTVSTIEITLSKDALDTSNKGYQPPIDESLVKEYDADEMARGRGRGRGGGRGKGRGKGDRKGKGRGKGKGKTVVLNLGYSHQVIMDIPEAISVEVTQNTKLTLKGCDKAELGLFAANIRSWRPPEPYKGKGVLYDGEIVRRKAGKSG